jgi:hypothetical protein
MVNSLNWRPSHLKVPSLLFVNMALFVNISNFVKCITIYSMLVSTTFGVLGMIVLSFSMQEEIISSVLKIGVISLQL